jgi:agarase
VLEAAAKNVDVFSADLYGPDPRAQIERYAAYKKPLLIAEFGFKAADSGLRNTGAGKALPTQQERAQATRHFLQLALAEPSVVGYHWFELIDQYVVEQSTNANWGLVNKDNVPYKLVVDTLTQVNAQMY